MIGKVKKWFGIEGLKIAVELEDKYSRYDQKVRGLIILQAKEEEVVESIRIKLIEKYSRGRGKNRLIDEYTMADELFTKTYQVEANSDFEIPFEISYQEMVSNMDEIERKNFLFKGVIALAKFARNANSIYRVEIEAKVSGTKFSPFVSQEIQFV